VSWLRLASYHLRERHNSTEFFCKLHYDASNGALTSGEWKDSEAATELCSTYCDDPPETGIAHIDQDYWEAIEHLNGTRTLFHDPSPRVRIHIDPHFELLGPVLRRISSSL
jgi:hypothetical protein